MKYISKFFIIALISFAGELLNYFIPLPIPGSIYGFVILFVLLLTKRIKADYIRPVTDFLLNVMPVTFIAPGVALMTMVDELKEMGVPIILTATLGTLLVMCTVAKTAEFILNRKEKK